MSAVVNAARSATVNDTARNATVNDTARNAINDTARNAMLGKIHVLAKQAGLKGDDYRDMLVMVTGKNSASDMNGQERLAVIEHLSGGKPGTGSRRKLDGPFAGKLQALWISAYNLGLIDNRDDAALLAFVKRQTGLDHTRFLHDTADAKKAIEALKGWLAREALVDWKDRPKRFPDDYHNRIEYRVALAQWAILKAADIGASADIAAMYAKGDGLYVFAARLGLGTGSVFHQIEKAQWHVLMNTLGARIRKLNKSQKLDPHVRGDDGVGV